MPKYTEPRETSRPVPGAFGHESSRAEWERRHRPNHSFLSGTGVYANHLRILIDEEYGYRDWLWTVNATIDEIVTIWCSKRSPFQSGRGDFDEVFWDFDTSPPSLMLKKTNERIECLWQPHKLAPVFGGADGLAHHHEEEDSYLRIGYYDIRGIGPTADVRFIPERVLDELAKIR
jgi:hypothetical protein